MIKAIVKKQFQLSTIIRNITFSILFLFSLQFSYSQDPIYSQFYIDPLQLNPGFTGNTFVPKFAATYRMQWPLISFAYNTYSLSYDQFFENARSGFGVNILGDNAGNGIYVHNRISLFYAYKMQIRDRTFFKAGLEASFVNGRLDWNKLTFTDQIDSEFGSISPGGTPYPTEEIQPERLNNNYLDASVGFLLYNPKFYVGFSVKHVNTPEDNFLGINKNLFSGLPMRISLQAGGEISLSDYNIGRFRTFISPNILYVRQGDFSQLNVGAFANMGVLFVGAWYRHAGSNPDAIILSTGIKTGTMRIGYSYDITISKLSFNSGGAHEIGISILIGEDEQKVDYNDCFQLFR